VEDIVKAATDIISQAKSGSPNIAQILQDAETIAADIKSATTDCKLASRTKKGRKFVSKWLMFW